MPYSSFIMMCILGLQLLALYLIIFLHKQLLAIGLVMASLVLSAVIVILSRKYRQIKNTDNDINEGLFNTITTLFNHINQRHYQLHSDFKKLLATVDLSENLMKKMSTTLELLHDKQDKLSQLSLEDGGESSEHMATRLQTEVHAITQNAKNVRHKVSQYRQEELNWLEARTTQLDFLQLGLERSSKLAEELRLMSLNLSIEASKLGLSSTGFARVANEVSRLARLSDKDNQQLTSNIAELATTIGSRSNKLRETDNTVTSVTVPEINVSHLLLEMSDNHSSSEQHIGQLQAQMKEIESLMIKSDVVTKQLAKQSHEIAEIDKDFKAIKEYFIECMINLDELKQGLLTTAEFHENLEKMNTMIAELYDTNKTVHLVNDVLK